MATDQIVILLGTNDAFWTQQVFGKQFGIFLFLLSGPPQQLSIYGRPGLLLLFGFSRVWNLAVCAQAAKTADSCGRRVDDALTNDYV